MCDCGCTTTDDSTTYDTTTYDATTYDTGYDNSTYDAGQQVYSVPTPVEATPVYTVPVVADPVPDPVTVDPGLSTNDQLLNSLNTLPPGSPVADTITSVLLQPGHDAAKWFEPTHDIYGNSL
jgi:hypothetical protein